MSWLRIAGVVLVVLVVFFCAFFAIVCCVAAKIGDQRIDRALKDGTMHENGIGPCGRKKN